MARSVTYAFYIDSYHGSAIEEANWEHVSQLASAKLEKLKTIARITPYGDEDECESMAICRMAEAFQVWEETSGTDEAGVASESIGSVDVSYASAEQVMPGGLDKACIKAIEPWLHVCLVVRC